MVIHVSKMISKNYSRTSRILHVYLNFKSFIKIFQCAIGMMILRHHQALAFTIRAHRTMDINRFALHDQGLRSMLEFYEELGYINENILTPPAWNKLTSFRNYTS